MNVQLGKYCINVLRYIFNFLSPSLPSSLPPSLPPLSLRLSASCVHVSGLLHALVAMNPHKRAEGSELDEIDDNEILPVTSQLCAWKKPRKHKETALKITEACFKKHVYGKAEKQTPTSLEDFDPRPIQYHGNAASLLPTLLNQVRGKGLCISLLFDEDTRVPCLQTSDNENLMQIDLLKKINELKLELTVSEDMAKKIEMDTKGQRNNPKWFEMRRFRLTASQFGRVRCLRDNTKPDSLVLKILGVKKIGRSQAMQWGIDNEELAMQQYVEYQHKNGHVSLYACTTGLYVSTSHSFLGASPDGAVFDITEPAPHGFLEMKCPYSQRHLTPVEACRSPGFFCKLDNGQPKLVHSHPYYSQVQGQMGIGERSWCDFVIYTEKGISVERIPYNSEFWEKELLPKLVHFWECCVAPEIVAPIHHLGQPIRDLRKEGSTI